MTGDFGWTLLYKHLGFSVSSGLKKSHQSHAVLWYKAVKVPASAVPPSRQHTPHCRCLKQGDTLTAHEASHPGESSLYTCKHSPTPRGKSGPKISYKGPSASHTQANSHCTETAPQAVLAFHWSVAPSQLSSTFFSTQSSLRCSSRPAESSHALSTDGKQTQAYCVLFLLTPGVGLCFKILVPCTENYLDTKNSQGFSVLGSHREQLGSSYTCPHTYCLRMVTSLSDILNNN